MFKLKQSAPRGCWLVGHRGAMGHAPENTMASYRLAQQMGAEFVECDVHLSKDKKVIVMHDEAVEGTTNGTGLIKNLSLDQIKRLDAGKWFSKKFRGEKVPTLEELLAWVKIQTSLRGFQMGLAIEIKNEPVRYLELPERLVKAVTGAEMVQRVILISFDHGALKRVKNLNKKIATGILYDRPLEDPIQRAFDMKAEALFPRRNLITKEMVLKAHNKGLAVATWTVNDPLEMKKIHACGVDAIATNYPDRLNEILEKKKS